MFELIGKKGYVEAKNVEYLGVIGDHRIPCKVIAYLDENTIITDLINTNELYMYGKIKIKDFHLIERQSEDY